MFNSNDPDFVVWKVEVQRMHRYVSKKFIGGVFSYSIMWQLNVFDECSFIDSLRQWIYIFIPESHFPHLECLLCVTLINNTQFDWNYSLLLLRVQKLRETGIINPIKLIFIVHFIKFLVMIKVFLVSMRIPLLLSPYNHLFI